MSCPAIHAQHLYVRLAGRQVLSIEELTVPSGQVFALIGPNGAGKSTFLKCCVGLQRLKRGRITVLGRQVHRLGRFALTRFRRRVGYLPQDQAAACQMPLTCREVVAIGRCGLAGLFRPLGKDDWRIIDRWLARLSLADLADRPYASLSGGQQRKTLIARAMVQQPELLILDEPTAHLDLAWREQIVSTIEQLYSQMHVTVVLVCHELEVLPACCSTVAVLERGNLTACGPPHEVLTRQVFESLYGPGLTIVHANGRHLVVPQGKGVA